KLHQANRRHQHDNSYDLKRQIVIAKKRRADAPHTVSRPVRKRRKSLSRGLEAPDREENLNEQNDRHGDPARGSEPIDSTSFFGLQVKEHDNEKKKHHYGARINQNLNDADKIGVE